MSFLSSLAGRALGVAPLLRPRLPSRFEPAGSRAPGIGTPGSGATRPVLSPVPEAGDSGELVEPDRPADLDAFRPKRARPEAQGGGAALDRAAAGSARRRDPGGPPEAQAADIPPAVGVEAAAPVADEATPPTRSSTPATVPGPSEEERSGAVSPSTTSPAPPPATSATHATRSSASDSASPAPRDDGARAGPVLDRPDPLDGPDRLDPLDPLEGADPVPLLHRGDSEVSARTAPQPEAAERPAVGTRGAASAPRKAFEALAPGSDPPVPPEPPAAGGALPGRPRPDRVGNPSPGGAAERSVAGPVEPSVPATERAPALASDDPAAGAVSRIRRGRSHTGALSGSAVSGGDAEALPTATPGPSSPTQGAVSAGTAGASRQIRPRPAPAREAPRAAAQPAESPPTAADPESALRRPAVRPEITDPPVHRDRGLGSPFTGGAPFPDPSEPTVRVTIGRVEVRNEPPPADLRPARRGRGPRRGPRLSLEGYLARRRGEGR